MTAGHKIEIISAGCICCRKAIEMVQGIADDNDEVIVLNIGEPSVANRAVDLGIRSVPAVLIDGKLADCCSNRGPDEDVIRSALKH